MFRLLLELRAKRLFAFRDVALITLRIDERVRAVSLQLWKLFFHPVVTPMSAQENVARESLKHPEHTLEVRCDLRIERIVDQLIARIRIRTADDHNVQHLAAIAGLHGP